MASRRTKRVFVAFAIEDRRYRDLLKGQSLLVRSPFAYTDMSAKEPWDAEWKSRCRTRIRGCDGVIALLSRNTAKATGQRWEIKCALDEGKPVLPIFIGDHRYMPPELRGRRGYVWRWNTIATFIDRL
jgi:nucleoside 2-deoxyribosyltransferase